MSYIPYRRPKFVPQAVKVILYLLGILLVAAGVVMIIVSTVLFWQSCASSCTASCQSYSCATGGPGTITFDNSWLIVGLVSFGGVIVGAIIWAVAAKVETKKSFLKKYPHAVFCPKCDELCDVREVYCPKCGELVDTKGVYKDKPKSGGNNEWQALNAASNSSNPYEAYMRARAGVQTASQQQAQASQEDSSPFEENFAPSDKPTNGEDDGGNANQ